MGKVTVKNVGNNVWKKQYTYKEFCDYVLYHFPSFKLNVKLPRKLQVSHCMFLMLTTYTCNIKAEGINYKYKDFGGITMDKENK